MRGKQVKRVRRAAFELEPGDRNFYRFLKRAFNKIPRNLRGIDSQPKS